MEKRCLGFLRQPLSVFLGVKVRPLVDGLGAVVIGLGLQLGKFHAIGLQVIERGSVRAGSEQAASFADTHQTIEMADDNAAVLRAKVRGQQVTEDPDIANLEGEFRNSNCPEDAACQGDDLSVNGRATGSDAFHASLRKLAIAAWLGAAIAEA